MVQRIFALAAAGESTRSIAARLTMEGVMPPLKYLSLIHILLLLKVLNSFIKILWFCGVQIIVFLVALQKIDGSMYEAASIDGASPWEAFWKITLPHLRPIIMLNAIYTIIAVSYTHLTTGILGNSAVAGLGMQAAATLIMFVPNLVLFIVLQSRVMNTMSHSGMK